MSIADPIVIFVTVGMAVWGYRQGVRVKLLLAVAFGIGALFGSRVGPLILDGGLRDPFAPAVALPAALLFGALFAAGAERAGFKLQWTLRRRYALDAFAGAALTAFLALVVVWSMAAAGVRMKSLEGTVESSAIVSGLNAVLPPPGPVLTSSKTYALPRAQKVRQPGFAPDFRIKADAEVKAAARAVVKIEVTKCGGLGEATGWIAGDGIVMTNAHVVERSTKLGVRVQGKGRPLDGEAIFYDRDADVSVLRVPGLRGTSALRLHPRPKVSSSVAVLGFPFGRRYKAREAVLGPTLPLPRGNRIGAPGRQASLLRSGLGLGPGVSGGPVVDTTGRVVAMIFGGSEVHRRRFQVAVPSPVMRAALRRALAAPRSVDTGTCPAGA